MAQRIRHILLTLLLLSLLTGAGAADTVFVDNFADLKNTLSSGGEKTVILTADIIAETSIIVNGKVTLTTEENTNHQISFERASAVDDGYLTVEKGTIFTIAGNKSGKITLLGKTSEYTSLISVQSGELRLKDTVLSANHLTGDGSAGGAIYVIGGKVSLERCTITDCSADYGGAVYLVSEEAGMVNGVITGTIISDCTAEYGGAVYTEYYASIPETSIIQYPYTKLTIAQSSIIRCTAPANGCGIFARAAEVDVSGVSFTDSNIFGKSSAVHAELSTLILSGAQNQMPTISLDRAVIHLKNGFAFSEHVYVDVISDRVVSSYLMKTDEGNITNVLGYFTFDLPKGLSPDDEDQTLYLSSYITFDANGGDGSLFYENMRCAVPNALPISPYIREGYTFAGWSETRNGAPQYDNAGLITIYGPTTLYAVWVPHGAGAYYVRTVANGDYVTFEDAAPLQYIDLPQGASGDLYCYRDAPDTWASNYLQAHAVFGLEITEYPAGAPTLVGISVSQSTLSAASAESVILYQYIEGEWTALETVCVEKGDSPVFEASANGLGLFAVVFEKGEGGTEPADSPLGVFALLGGLGATCLLRRR